MSIRIIYGKSGAGKSEFCYKEIAEIINDKNRNEKIFIITPEQFSFTAEKKLMESINKTAVFQAEVLTLSRMAYRVLNEVGGATNTHLTKCGKSMLIFDILNKNKQKLKFLGKSDENIDLCVTALTELKKHNITNERLEEEINSIDEKNQDGKYLKTKLEDINLVYKSFEEQIKNKYIEENDLLTILSQNINKTQFAQNSIIYFDEFAGFTAQEYNVIKELAKQAKQINITLCIDNTDIASNPNTDVFYANKKTLNKINILAKENNIKLEKPILIENINEVTVKNNIKEKQNITKNNKNRFKTPELAHLETNLYTILSTNYVKTVDNLHLFLAKNEYTEVENIAKNINKLVRDKKVRYKDIAIITKNIEKYASLVRAIFDRFEIPVFIDEKRELSQNIIIQYILAVLEIINKNFAIEAIFNYLKIGFVKIEQDEIFKLENYATKWGIKYNKWKKEFKFEEDERKEEVKRLEEIRKQLVNPIIKLQEKIGKDNTVEEITKNIYNFLLEQDIEGQINYKIKELIENGQIDLSNEYISSYQTLINVLDEIVLVFKDEKMSIEQYTKLLKVGLKNSNLSKIPGTQDQVIFGDVDRTRSHKVKIAFIIGVNDGVFPSVNRDEGFLNDEDRERLKADGIELANGTLENLYEENFNIYKVFTTAEEQIYISYDSSDTEGNSLRPSMLISKIKKMFPKLKEESDVVTKKHEIVNKENTYQELLEKIAESSKKQDENKMDEIWLEIYKYYYMQNAWKEKIEEDIKGLFYTNIPENIEKDKIEKLYGNTLRTNVSKLETFRSCPFLYYLQYGLKLKETEKLEIKSFNTGAFMHETIDKFFQEVREEEIDINEITEERIQELVSEIIDQNLKMGKNYIFTATAKYRALVKRLKRLVSKALKYIIETITLSSFNIEGTEIEFGEKGKYKPIIMELEDGKKVEIVGKIDRIDTANSVDGKYLRIIDYKSSSKNIDLDEVYAGLQIQLLTYTNAICREEDIMPAGVFYFSLLEQMVKADKRMTQEEIEEQIKKNFKMKGLIIADIKIIKMHDNTLEEGASKLVPAGITKSGAISKKYTNGVNKEDFKKLQDFIDKTIVDIAKEIYSGKIDLKPFYKKGKKSCDYCDYKVVCGFNPALKDNIYKFI